MYRARFYQTWKLVLILVVVPNICMIIFLPPLFYLPPWEWLTWVAVFLGLGSAILLTAYLNKKIVTQNCTVQPLVTGLSVIMDQPVPFFARSFTVPWAKITNASVNVDKEAVFIQVKSKKYPGNFMLSAPDKSVTDPEKWDLWIALNEQIDHYNLHPTGPEIKKNGFFGGRWAEVLSFIWIVFLILSLVLKISGTNDEIRWYSIIALFVMGLPFALGVFAARAGKHQSDGNQVADEQPNPDNS